MGKRCMKNGKFKLFMITLVVVSVFAGYSTVVYAQNTQQLEENERSVFDPFTLSTFVTATQSESIERPAIRITYRPQLRSYFRPSLVF